jgi:hypothetical protein
MSSPSSLAQVSPAEWGAKIDYDAHPAVAGRDGTVGHWTGTKGTQTGLLAASDVRAAERALLRRIEQDHLDQKWKGAAYSFSAGPSGELYRIRGYSAGAHNPADSDGDGVSDNRDGFGFLFMVGPDETPTDAMLRTAGRFFDSVGGWVAGHNLTRNTQCPGPAVGKWLADYKAGVRPVSEPTPTESTWTEELVKNLPTLKKRPDLGRTSDDDRRAQGLLAAAGTLEIQPNLDGRRFDGKFGDSTDEAVRKFQKSRRLSVDGVIGRNTWEGLLGE